ncbi:unnamed protein product [Colletotrichum noveboracense]|uniref:O-methyltransferase C-terminal domain-containing protein n=1 Tax=Colletotrichum noveboracense TaxID=2664923 RepID=A0A9W4RGX9_9PEZI|nr:hypothetical protein K456DRAFT_1843045 [Colletotrichum gloeosporioides 23]KAJ0273309.1 hypothetical protein COL940_009935 [Colletotrichum noveboracense]KAJ0280011.1 hypothetical protein CBS470a_008982 [Colletotrichum nupharicola]KAJ0320947.1 hypothetical protein Brms1b_002900 [Colletotrichum noveboracense]CAI0641140.1 unnamed protein product [Colletotrichum noveboracense]
MAAPTTISRLAESIFSNTKIVDSYLKANDLPSPSFDADGPTNLEIDAESAENARVKVLESTLELFDLLQGPAAILRPVAYGTSLQAISRWDIPNKVPLDKEISFTELAHLCDVHETDIRRILRYAMVYHRLFCEPRPGFVAHSLASKRLVQEPSMADGLWLLGDHVFGTAARTVDALEKFKDQEPSHTAMAILKGKEQSGYDAMKEDPQFARRFAKAMMSFANRSESAPRVSLVYPELWASLGKGTVVDVGGSRGADAIHLASKYPDLNFIVQDLPPMMAGAEAAVPAELKGRIRFMPYDFFTPQTQAADAYMIKQCFHNWPDHYCVRIIRNQIPLMKPGCRLIVIDSLVPEPGTMSLMAERMVRAFDMLMLTQGHGREREGAEWIELFKQADPRFKIRAMKPISKAADFGPATGLIEVIWQG